MLTCPSFLFSHRPNLTYWQVLNETGWAQEMDGMRTILETFAHIPEGDVAGARAPNQQNGGEAQMSMLKDYDFTYDSTMPTDAFAYVNLANGLWPYTFDYKSTQVCIYVCTYVESNW